MYFWLVIKFSFTIAKPRKRRVISESEDEGTPLKRSKLTSDNKEKDFDLNLPFAQLQDFQNFENQLEADRMIRKRFKSTLSDLFTTDISVTLAQKNMIQKYISRSVIMQYTAQKKTDKKSLIFKNTRFYRAMLDDMSSKYKAQKLILTEKDFLRDLC
ncbi:uncharacterized protein LOC117171054 [Belonocnema kinseyi]|uniref:uncharacterized protein LOC117171054 n=1 Tax=Belonocnema kinseyi TaxID=2817044 RepID=UPI00143DDBA2|nr:uncharacterized protein LOC117171054 [Belonocnema kinseyi]